MLIFGNPYFAYLFLLVPVILFFIHLRRKAMQKQLESVIDPKLLPSLLMQGKPTNRMIQLIIPALFLTFLITALLDPQLGTRLEVVKRKGNDVIIALDISRSMLTRDVVPSRLERAKREMKKFIAKLMGDRIGIILFAGVAYTQCPLTTDYAAVEMYLDVIHPGIIPVQGTEIGKAIKEAIRAFPDSTNKQRILLLITDGEDHATEETMEAIKMAKKNNLKIYTVGVGSPAGSLIPLYDENGKLTGYLKDENNNYVTSRLNAQLLEAIAMETGGKSYILGTAGDDLDAIVKELESMEKQEIYERRYAQFEHRYQFFVILALISLFLEIFRYERFNKWK